MGYLLANERVHLNTIKRFPALLYLSLPIERRCMELLLFPPQRLGRSFYKSAVQSERRRKVEWIDRGIIVTL